MKHIAIPNIKIMCLQAITIDKSDVDFTVFSCSIFIYVNHLSNRYDNLRHTLTLRVNFKWTYMKEDFWWTIMFFRIVAKYFLHMMPIWCQLKKIYMENRLRKHIDTAYLWDQHVRYNNTIIYAIINILLSIWIFFMHLIHSLPHLCE